MTNTKVRNILLDILHRDGDIVLFRTKNKLGMRLRDFHVTDVLKEFDRGVGDFYRILTENKEIARLLSKAKKVTTIEIEI